jgi:hypothetical protein
MLTELPGKFISAEISQSNEKERDIASMILALFSTE